MSPSIKATTPNQPTKDTTMYQRRDYNTNESISCGFKASGKLAEAINLAAELNKAPSKSSYLKQLVAERVSEALGVPVESFIDPEPDTSTAQQEAVIATARLQQTIADAEAALKQLRKQAAPRRAASISGTRRRVG